MSRKQGQLSVLNTFALQIFTLTFLFLVNLPPISIPMGNYDFKAIEKKWQKMWREQEVFRAERLSDKPKYYVLDMFPYPSGSGLHVGHPLGYVATDIVARYKRMQGFNVLHPMGFDAFGLPAEQYALETGTHPAVSTLANIKRFQEQLTLMGLGFDPSTTEMKSCEPEYYKWTQWIFLQIFNSWFNLDTQKAESISSLISRFEIMGSEGTRAYGNYEGSFSARDWKSFSEEEKHKITLHFRPGYRTRQRRSDQWRIRARRSSRGAQTHAPVGFPDDRIRRPPSGRPQPH
jgi:leucyl-tRNA synthetase